MRNVLQINSPLLIGKGQAVEIERQINNKNEHLTTNQETQDYMTTKYNTEYETRSWDTWGGWLYKH